MTQNERFDDWLVEESSTAALTMRQPLLPVEGADAIVFPPTYPIEQNKAGYNIDEFDDGSNVCQIDSVGSQANRMEPLFMKPAYAHLVPQVVIEAGDRSIHLLEAGHRAADAIVRFSTLGPQLHEAYLAFQQSADAEPLARIAPTSIVFGSWDSRATQAKLPRIVRSVIRAYNVRELTRSAQYSTIAGEILADGEAEVTTKGPKAELGLAHVPSVQTHGGVQLQGDKSEIRREAILNLGALRAIAGPTDERTLELRRYVLGLALVSLTAPTPPNLREGCELVAHPERSASWETVEHDGTRRDLSVSHADALEFATGAAEAFGVNSDETKATFDSKHANEALKGKGSKAKGK